MILKEQVNQQEEWLQYMDNSRFAKSKQRIKMKYISNVINIDEYSALLEEIARREFTIADKFVYRIRKFRNPRETTFRDEMFDLIQDIYPEKELAERVSRIPSNSVVLLDDVDTMIKSRNEIDKMSSSNQKDYYSYIQSIMNMLDGAISPNKVVFVACTNYIDKLDDAFKRPSRFDLQMEISNITYDDAVRMCNYYGVDVNVLQGIELPCSPAKLKHIIFNNVDI